MGSVVDAENFEGNFKVIRGHARSNGVTLVYGHETWWVGSIVDAKKFEGHFNVIRGHPRSNEVKWGKHWCMDMKLGGWGQLLIPKMLMVTSRSSGLK